MKFKRDLGPTSVIFSAIGGVIGSAWLFGPFYAAKIAGPASIFSWIIGGVMISFIAFTFAELATMFPVAGSAARLSTFSHGTLVGYTVSLCAWLSTVTIAPIETIALIQYSSSYLPGLMKLQNGEHVLTWLGLIIASLVMLLMCFINYFGIKWVSKINNLTVVFKLLVPVLTIVSLFYVEFNLENFTDFGFAPNGLKGVFEALPTAGVIFSFIGFNTAIQLAGEAKNPKKMIPLAVFGSTVSALILYLLLQLAFIGALAPNPDTGWAGLSFQFDNSPFVGIALSLGLVWLSLMLFADAIISPFGTALLNVTAAARINFAMSKTGFLPKFGKKITKRGVPFNAIIFNYFVGLLLLIPFSGWQQMVGFLISAFNIAFAIGPIALLSLRDHLPKKKNAFRVPCINLFCFISFYISTLLAFWTGWENVWKLLVMIIMGYIYLFFFRKQKLFTANAAWLIPYLSGIGLLSYLGSFKGGLGLLIFGMDFIVFLFFSLAVFLYAKKLANQKSDIKESLKDIAKISREETSTFKDLH